MSHFLLYVVGDDADAQLAIYNSNLQVQTFKERLDEQEISRVMEHYGVSDVDDIVDVIQDWTTFLGGYDEAGFFYWSTSNPRAKFDWCILGGRWCGHLRLRQGCSGDIGKRGAGVPEDEPLPHGELSADRALFGDIDWDGMRALLLVEAERVWHDFEAHDAMGHPARYKYGIEPWMDKESFLRARSVPAPFAVLKDSEWYERGNKGWWGPILDADPVEGWHKEFDDLMSDCRPETLITVIDCHIQGGP